VLPSALKERWQGQQSPLAVETARASTASAMKETELHMDVRLLLLLLLL
jgi:hypothetical protein